MREYKIFKTNLGYGVLREDKESGITQFLTKGKRRWNHKSGALTFYTKDAAASALVVVRGMKEEIQEKNPEEPNVEKRSRAEL